MNFLFSLLRGFGISCGLIVAIGAQNAFVIRQGLTKQHLFLTALLCSIIDACLIICGVIGFGYYVEEGSRLLEIVKYFAAIFLITYGLLAFRSAFKNQDSLQVNEEKAIHSAQKTVVTVLALSLLNPHVYLDTVFLLGSIASQHSVHERIFFAVGAIAASFIWFFGLTFGARLLAPLLKKRHAWKVVDIAIGVMMCAIGLSLI